MLPHRSFDLSDLRLTPDETGRRRPQIPRRHIHCPQWRKARPQARSLDLEHPDWRRQVAQPPWSQIDEVYSAEQARRRLGQQDLNTVPGSHHPRRTVEHRTEVIGPS
jgi:hypothetical protein